MKETLLQVISTLNQITVNGEANMDRLLGCIWTLKKLAEDKQGDDQNG